MLLSLCVTLLIAWSVHGCHPVLSLLFPLQPPDKWYPLNLSSDIFSMIFLHPPDKTTTFPFELAPYHGPCHNPCVILSPPISFLRLGARANFVLSSAVSSRTTWHQMDFKKMFIE